MSKVNKMVFYLEFRHHFLLCQYQGASGSYFVRVDEHFNQPLRKVNYKIKLDGAVLAFSRNKQLM